MLFERTEMFRRDFRRLPQPVQRRTERQITMLVQNPRYPSLRLQKMEGVPGIWEGRITQNYRFTFEIRKDRYVLRRIGTHAILRTP